MKKIIAILAATTILFFGLWVHEITNQSDAEQLCQHYASGAAGSLQSFEMSKELNEEPLMGNYWAGVSQFYAFMDTLHALPDDGGRNEATYNNCSVIYDHMILAPDEVLAHMDEVLAAMELVGEDFTSSEARQALSQLSYNFQSEESEKVVDIDAETADEEISINGTVFTYKGVAHDVTELDASEYSKLVYSLFEYKYVGEHILVIGSIGKNAAFYGVFNPATQEFEHEIVGAQFIYKANDIQSAVYSFENSVYDYDGNLLKMFDLDESEYICDIAFDESGTQLLVEIATYTSDETPREEIISLIK